MKSIIYKILTAVILAIFAFSIFLWYSKPDQTENAPVVSENYNQDLPEPTNTQTGTTSLETSPAPVATEGKSKYKDGTYSVTSSYGSPAGPEDLGVSLTIKNDVVVDANITNKAGDRTSVNFQNKFISGYKTQVIGKNIDSIKLGVVSGSSLTPNGFNTAVANIKTQAMN